MNLDVITSSYREAELRKVLLSARLDEKLLLAAERFSSGLKFVLVLALMGISLGVVALFVRDAVNLVVHRDAHGVLTALGSLLVIWVMVELMENEIRQLRGGRFKITIFLGVALVAFIREILISSLQHGTEPQVGYYLLGAILTIGVVYWLITRAEASAGRTASSRGRACRAPPRPPRGRAARPAGARGARRGPPADGRRGAAATASTTWSGCSRWRCGWGPRAARTLRVLALAALLHDVGRGEEDRSGGAICHAAAGAALAREILRRHGAAPRSRRVADCVRRHRSGARRAPRAARRSCSTTRTSSTRSARSGSAGRSCSPARSAPGCTTPPAAARRAKSLRARGHRAPRVAGSSCATSRGGMLTPAGRRLAAERSAFVAAFFARLDAEVAGAR